MKSVRYNKFHILLDLFGLFGLGLTIYFYYQGHTVRQTNEELHALWANFATEIVAIWLGVRIIEYVIRRHEKESSIRLRTVKNMRFLMRSMRNEIEYPRRGDLEQLKHEFNWTKRMFGKHRKTFRQDELIDVNAFYSDVEATLTQLNNLLQMRIDHDTGTKSRHELETKKEELWSLVDKLEEVRLKAEENILAETEEEWT